MQVFAAVAALRYLCDQAHGMWAHGPGVLSPPSNMEPMAPSMSSKGPPQGGITGSFVVAGDTLLDG